MIEFNEALDISIRAAHTLGVENVSLEHALYRVLAEDVICDTNIPSFDKSAMDGYACRDEDVNLALRQIEIIVAGTVPEKEIVAGTCSKIMTGAMLPKGATRVIRVEDSKVVDNKVVFVDIQKGRNIRYIAEEAKKGAVLLLEGQFVKAQQIAVMASVGQSRPTVYKQPSVVVISTGSELVEPDCIPLESQIRNSNALQLINQVKSMGIPCEYLGIVDDNKKDLTSVIQKAKALYDVILISGGVSMGEYDFVPEVLTESGFITLFQKIKIKPGKPILFVKDKDKYCFGMPGNPVSSFVLFEILVKPFLFALQGNKHTGNMFSGLINCEYSLKDNKLLQFIPVKIIDNQFVEPITYKGSAHISAIALADGLMEMPVGTSKLTKGDKVNVRLL